MARSEGATRSKGLGEPEGVVEAEGAEATDAGEAAANLGQRKAETGQSIPEGPGKAGPAMPGRKRQRKIAPKVRTKRRRHMR